MGIETFENTHLEKISVSDLSSVQEVLPILLQKEDDQQESFVVNVEAVEQVETSADRLESFRRNGTEKLEVLYDSEVTEQIAEYLSGLEELRFENWTKLSLEQRKELLNRIERQIAAIEHRPPLPIDVEKMKASTFGYQSSYYHKIALNSLYVGSNSKKDYNEVIDTIIHEGRHAYQHYNVDKKLIHESASVVNTWRENFYNPKYQYYNSGSCIIPVKGRLQDVGFRLYYYQPVEIDARNFASDVMLKLKQKGFLS